VELVHRALPTDRGPHRRVLRRVSAARCGWWRLLAGGSESRGRILPAEAEADPRPRSRAGADARIDPAVQRAEVEAGADHALSSGFSPPFQGRVDALANRRVPRR